MLFWSLFLLLLLDYENRKLPKIDALESVDISSMNLPVSEGNSITRDEEGSSISQLLKHLLEKIYSERQQGRYILNTNHKGELMQGYGVKGYMILIRSHSGNFYCIIQWPFWQMQKLSNKISGTWLAFRALMLYTIDDMLKYLNAWLTAMLLPYRFEALAG